MAKKAKECSMSRQASAKGFLENLKDILNPSKLIHTIQENKEMLFHIAIFWGAGFLIGFFLKKYSRYVAALVFITLALIGLDYIGLISISVQWDRLHDLFGVEPLMHVEGNVLTMYAEWVRANFFITVSFVVGFFFGIRIG
jgi:uncharacterized membrane protein (Fun14 family)